MARARNIKPGFFHNEELVELPFATRLLFVGLWTIADRAGRLEDRPKKIKMAIFPADDVDVDAALQSLHEAGFIVRYAAKGGAYIAIPAWAKHQNPHHREPESLIPAPGETEAETEQAQVEPEASPRQALGEPGSSRADSGFLIPDSCPDGQARARVREEPAFDVLACPDTVNGEAWAQWVDHRRKRRKPISERAAAEQWRALACLSPPQQAACIAHSIRNDYQGLFPEKFGGANGNGYRPGGDTSPDRSAAGRVRAKVAAERAAWSGTRAGADGVAAHGFDVRDAVDGEFR